MPLSVHTTIAGPLTDATPGIPRTVTTRWSTAGGASFARRSGIAPRSTPITPGGNTSGLSGTPNEMTDEATGTAVSAASERAVEARGADGAVVHTASANM